MPENSRKGMSMIMIVIFIVVALLVFAMIGGGFKGSFTGIMDKLENAVSGAFGGDFFGDGGESFKIEIKSPNRELLEIGVYDSEGEKVYGKPKPSSVIQTGLKEGNKYTLFFIFRNKLGQKVKAESAEFKVGEKEKVEFTAEVKEDKGYGGGSYFLDEAEMKPKDILIELPPYMSSSEHVKITRDKWTYGEKMKLPVSFWGGDKNGIALVKSIDMEAYACCFKTPVPPMLIIEAKIDGKKVPFFSSGKLGELPTTSCIKEKSCIKERNADIKGSPCSDEGNYDSPTGWVADFGSKIFLESSEPEAEISLKAYGSFDEMVVSGCGDLSDSGEACDTSNGVEMNPAEYDTWKTDKFLFEFSYRKVCPAGYTMVKGDCEKIEK